MKPGKGMRLEKVQQVFKVLYAKILLDNVKRYRQTLIGTEV